MGQYGLKNRSLLLKPVVLRCGEATCLHLMCTSFTAVKCYFFVMNAFVVTKDGFVVVNQKLYFNPVLSFTVVSLCLRYGELLHCNELVASILANSSFAMANGFVAANDGLHCGEPMMHSACSTLLDFNPFFTLSFH